MDSTNSVAKTLYFSFLQYSVALGHKCVRGHKGMEPHMSSYVSRPMYAISPIKDAKLPG
jgi:hypothetical protein